VLLGGALIPGGTYPYGAIDIPVQRSNSMKGDGVDVTLRPMASGEFPGRRAELVRDTARTSSR